ncbi:nitrate- and nitrite sensing domain-containing protein [Yokenella regensburgei]|uniref:nitrate regulatory protein NasR n=1 Tax=Yokenella regensburgei TaxID=158877 RepID=UPI003F13801C
MNERTDATAWFRYARHIQKNQLRQLAQLGVLAGKISHLTHMLQCERGASNIWLCSRGRLYGLECRASSALADEQIAVLMPVLDGLKPLTSSALCHRIAAAVAGLEQLPLLRKQIKEGEIDAELAMAQFSRILSQLLSIIPRLNDSIDDPAIAARLVALYSFMQGKELVGQERALGALGFTHGQFSSGQRQALVDRIDGQQSCFDTFLSLTDPGIAALFSETCGAGLETEQMRRLACTRMPPQDKGDNALRWFSLQTQRLEQLRTLEETLITALNRETERLLSEDDDLIARHTQQFAPEVALLWQDKTLLPLVRQQAQEIEQLSQQLASLKDTLEERRIIDKAKSVLMNHQQLSEEQAWQCLRKMAMDKNQRMVDIARALLTVRSLWELTPKE